MFDCVKITHGNDLGLVVFMAANLFFISKVVNRTVLYLMKCGTPISVSRDFPKEEKDSHDDIY
jgi:hypothetical protein